MIRSTKRVPRDIEFLTDLAFLAPMEIRVSRSLLRPHSGIRSLQLISSTHQLPMAQVAPLTTSDVTVVVFTPKDEDTDKMEIVEQPTSMKQKIIVGVLYTLVSSGFIYGGIATITFFGDVFTLLLVATRC